MISAWNPGVRLGSRTQCQAESSNKPPSHSAACDCAGSHRRQLKHLVPNVLPLWCATLEGARRKPEADMVAGIGVDGGIALLPILAIAFQSTKPPRPRSTQGSKALNTANTSTSSPAETTVPPWSAPCLIGHEAPTGIRDIGNQGLVPAKLPPFAGRGFQARPTNSARCGRASQLGGWDRSGRNPIGLFIGSRGEGFRALRPRLNPSVHQYKFIMAPIVTQSIPKFAASQSSQLHSTTAVQQPARSVQKVRLRGRSPIPAQAPNHGEVAQQLARQASCCQTSMQAVLCL